MSRRRVAIVPFIGLMGLVALLVTLPVGGCAKGQSDDHAPTMPEPVDPAEAERGQDACRAYVEQVCACAKTKPDDKELAETCHMAPAKVSNLEAVLEVNRTTEDITERFATQNTARRIMKSCIEEQAKLLSKGCRSIPGQAQPK